eukprot:symbB.v1.2.015232.t1/scaffold1132.1/size136097/3
MRLILLVQKQADTLLAKSPQHESEPGQAMGQSPCSRYCEMEEDGDSTNREQPMSTAERHRYEEEFERHVQKVLRQGAKEVWCSQCGVRFVSRSGSSTLCPACR